MMVFTISLMLQWLAGLGLLASTRTRLPKSVILPLALLSGMFVHNVLFFAVDLLHLGFRDSTVMGAGVIATLLCNAWLPRVREFYAWLFSKPTFTLRMYDLVVLGYGVMVGYYVVWAAWYWPVTPFDAMAGIDLVAREAVSEGTINNRVFTDPSMAGMLSNQPFYAPFAMLMQVMYRIMGFAYGQVWLGIVAVATSWFFFGALRQFAHPLIASILWLLLILTPELLGYTYLLQTDYVNAAYLSIGVALLALGTKNNDSNAWWISAFMLGAACWSRTETVMLVAMGLIASVVVWKSSAFRGDRLKFLIGTATLSLLFFWLWNGMYVQWVLPVHPDTARELVGFDPSRFVSVLSDTMTNVVADTGLWGMAFILFAVGLVGNAIAKRSFGNAILLAWIVAVFLGLVLVGTIFSAAIVEQTLRRGMFKLIPLMFLYVAALPVVKDWSERLQSWENGRA